MTELDEDFAGVSQQGRGSGLSKPRRQDPLRSSSPRSSSCVVLNGPSSLEKGTRAPLLAVASSSSRARVQQTETTDAGVPGKAPGGEGAWLTEVPRVGQEQRSPRRWPEGQTLGAEGRLGALISSEHARGVSSRKKGAEGEGTEELREPGACTPARAARLERPVQRRVGTWLPANSQELLQWPESQPGRGFSWGIRCDFEHVVGVSVPVSSPVNQG